MPTGKRPLPGPLSLAVADLLNSAIARNGLRQAELATAADISPSQLSRILAGAKVFTVDQLDAACIALGIDIGDLLTQASARAADRVVPDNVIVGAFGVGGVEEDEPAAARPRDPDTGDTNDD